MPASQFNVQGGVVYAGAPGYDDRTWKPEALWMPRFSFGYKLGEKNVIKGGYGVYYDTVNARDFAPNQEGYDVTTTNPVSTDFGQTWLLGDPKNGILPLVDPFPVRQRQPVSDSRRLLARRRHHPRSRWRRLHGGEPQPACTRACSGGASAGSGTWAAARCSMSRMPARMPTARGSPSARTILPEQYWSSANVRDTSANDFLTANVPNPFNIANFASLQTSNPALYARLAANAFFTSTTIPRHRLLRAVPAHEQLEQRPAHTTISRWERSSPTRSSSS